jgi:hypothetical protein
VTTKDALFRNARAVAGLIAGLAIAGYSAGAGAAETGSFSANYSISIAGIPIGRAAAESRFNGSRYTLTINGFTSGISRLVSDATANLASNGSIYGSRVLPASYRLDTVDGGRVSSIEIRMNGGTVTNVTAVPEMRESPDRVPLNGKDKQNVVDPLSALILPAPGVGKMTAEEACDRTVRIFDGWQRFDVRLSFKRQREIKGPDGAYSGPVYVCGARFIPVAGHVPKRVKSLANNKSIEIWLAPVSDMSLLVPYSIQLNIQIGTLVVRANYLKFGPPSERAAAE